MKVEKKDLPKSQVELTVEVEVEELKPFLEQAASELSKEMKIEGFRPGKVPYEIMKEKVGEVPIMETAARSLINKKMDQLITEHVKDVVVGQPMVDITRLAPGNSLAFKIVLALLPKIELGAYKDLNIVKEVVKADDREVEKMITQLCENQVKEVATDQAVKENSKVVVDIKMFLEKVPVDGGQSKDTAVIIGKDYIIPGFDKQLIGAKKGDVKKFDLVYPVEHHQSNLAGKKVEFEVTVKDVFERQLPEVNDDLAKKFGLKSLPEMKENIKKSIEQEKQTKSGQKAELDMLAKIADSTTFSEIPDSLIANEVKLMFQEMEYHLSMQGAKLDDYLQSIKKTKEDISKEFQPEALKRIKSGLVINDISKKEKIEASTEELEKELENILSHYKDNEEVQARIKSPSYKGHLASQLAHKKTLEQLREWNIK